MRIGIDARMFGPQQGGLGRYIEQLILHLEKNELAANSAKTEFVIFLRSANWNDYTPSSPRFTKVLADIPWYGWREQLFFSPIIRRARVNLMHFPHWNVPLVYHQPFVVTIHDLILLHYPTRRASTLGPIKYWLKNLFFKLVLNHAAHAAQQIIAPSQFTKQDIAQSLNVSADKITVTELAPLPSITQIPNTKYRLPNTSYSITKPYLLYVGVAYPHKNLEGLLRAWKIFCDEHGQNYQLVLAGKKNYFYEQLTNLPIIQSFNHSVVFTDFVPDADLPALYQNAALYIFPSLYEGFGLPPLEAIQYNVPVVSSNAGCLPEILRDAALYFDPNDYPAMAQAIWRGLTDQTTRSQLIAGGVKLIHSYDWSTTAQKTWEVYQRVV